MADECKTKTRWSQWMRSRTSLVVPVPMQSEDGGLGIAVDGRDVGTVCVHAQVMTDLVALDAPTNTQGVLALYGKLGASEVLIALAFPSPSDGPPAIVVSGLAYDSYEVRGSVSNAIGDGRMRVALTTSKVCGAPGVVVSSEAQDPGNLTFPADFPIPIWGNTSTYQIPLAPISGVFSGPNYVTPSPGQLIRVAVDATGKVLVVSTPAEPSGLARYTTLQSFGGNTQLESRAMVRRTPGKLYSLAVTLDAAVAAPRWVLVYDNNQDVDPAIGLGGDALILAPFQVNPGDSRVFGLDGQLPVEVATGIKVQISATRIFTAPASANEATIWAQHGT